MIKIYVELEDKQMESVVKTFIEDFYYIKISSRDMTHIKNDSSVLITDKQEEFEGHLVCLAPLSLDECREKSKGRIFYLPRIELEMYRFLLALDDTFNEIKKEKGTSTNDSYLAVPTKYSSLLTGLNLQVYQKTGSLHFSKVIGANDNLNKSFYIERKKSHVFLDRVKAHLINDIEGDDLSLKKRILSAHDLAKLIGISNSTIKSVDLLTENLITELSQVDDLKNYLDSILFENDDYGNTLKLTMYCCVELCKSISSLVDERIYRKLITAAIFMDLELESDKTRQILSLDDSFCNFTKSERNLIRYHPTQGADKLNKYSQFGQDELLLIERHHEKPDGTGFPRGLTSNTMTVLQNIFITSYRFSHHTITESKRKGVSSRSIVKKVAETMSGEGFTQGQVMKYFSFLIKSSIDDA